MSATEPTTRGAGEVARSYFEASDRHVHGPRQVRGLDRERPRRRDGGLRHGDGTRWADRGQPRLYERGGDGPPARRDAPPELRPRAGDAGGHQPDDPVEPPPAARVIGAWI